VVGVAPGARFWGIRVMQQDGSMTTLEVIAALDYVTANAGLIEVANMSLGFVGSSSALDQAIASTVEAGVTVVVSAGNEALDVSQTSPGGHPDVITVSALADFDGEPGGLLNQGFTYSSPGCTENEDDSFACFSNFGSGVDIMAPGTKIKSTYLNGGTATMHGTSMSSPHVAGAAAIYLANNTEALPATVKAALIATGDAAPCDTPSGYCADDPDGIYEPMVLLAPFSEPDGDGDGVSNQQDNCPLEANPLQEDGDADGVGDLCDVCPAVHNQDTSDDDLDDLTAFEECLNGTDPTLWDSDGEGLSDGDEVNLYGTDPVLIDTDGDGFDDYVEVAAGSDPLVSGSIPEVATGDINGDSTVDIRDVLIGQRVILGLDSLDQAQLLRGDVAPLDANGIPTPNGVFDLGDVLLITRKAIGQIIF